MSIQVNIKDITLENVEWLGDKPFYVSGDMTYELDEFLEERLRQEKVISEIRFFKAKQFINCFLFKHFGRRIFHK